MHMQVLNFLATLRTGVTDDTETSVRIGFATLLQSQGRGQRHHVAHQRRMFRPELRHRGNMRLGYHQEVNRRPRMDVVKSKNMLVLVDLF